MKISHEKPPQWDRIRAAFNLRWESGVLITIGDTIYTTSHEIPADFLVHEKVHIDQQRGIDPDLWINRYISDRDFRLQVELEAYRAQADYLRQTIKDRNELARRLVKLAIALSRNYDCMISFRKAQKLL